MQIAIIWFKLYVFIQIVMFWFNFPFWFNLNEIRLFWFKKRECDSCYRLKWFKKCFDINYYELIQSSWFDSNLPNFDSNLSILIQIMEVSGFDSKNGNVIHVTCLNDSKSVLSQFICFDFKLILVSTVKNWKGLWYHFRKKKMGQDQIEHCHRFNFRIEATIKVSRATLCSQSFAIQFGDHYCDVRQHSRRWWETGGKILILIH